MNMQRRARRSPNWPRTTRFGTAGVADSQTESRVVNKLTIITRVVACIVAVFFLVVSAAGQVASVPESIERCRQ